MRVKCLHGYFKFYETSVGEASKFASFSKLALVPVDDYFTFEKLEEAPDYSLVGVPILAGSPAIKRFGGFPWEVFEENRVVYNFVTGVVMPIDAITMKTTLFQSGAYFIAPRGGLILPGSLTSSGQRVKNYSAWFSWSRSTWLYSEVGLE